MSGDNGREIITGGARAQVLLPLVLREPFDYAVPEGMEVAAGDWVHVSFGKKFVWGVVWGKGAQSVERSKLKSIERIAAHLPPMSTAMRGFIDWVAWYTLAPKGMVLKMSLSAPEALEPPVREPRYLLPPDVADVKITPARQRIISYLSAHTPCTAKEILLHARISPAVLREFIKVGGLREMEYEAPHPSHALNHTVPVTLPSVAPALSPAQQSAADLLRDKLGKGFSVSVLDGVTGSGKTEVYFDTIAACLERGRQALVLLPEIALSVQWLSRFEKRFGFAPCVWHSGVTQAKKREAWRSIATGDAQVVVGARSALFLPFLRLGLIVVDEEHDNSYKQEDGVIYHARDMAVARASHEKILSLLVSATPSLETEYNITRGRYVRVHLPHRHGGAAMPLVHLLDMRKEPLDRGNWLSESLRQTLVATVAAKQQAMLFINRRGYAPLMLCRACGHRFQCPHCAAWLVFHRAKSRLLCHHCGHVAPIPKQCPACHQENCLIPYGPGVERIAEEVRLLLPEARIEVMTSDHIDTPEKADALIQAMTKGEIDVLIGTQMIAKGHHFSGLAMVGVIDADMGLGGGLGGGDLRASERTYQLLHQLAGRSGREKTPGEAWLQTYMPEHPVMQALLACDRDRFMALEAQMREDAGMPPFGKLAALIVEGRNEQEVAVFARTLVRNAGQHGHKAIAYGVAGIAVVLPRAESFPEPVILGPTPAPITLLRGKYRYRILVKANRRFLLQAFLTQWLGCVKMPSSLKIKIDIDPYSFI